MAEYFDYSSDADMLTRLRDLSGYSKQPRRVRKILDTVFSALSAELMQREKQLQLERWNREMLLQSFLPTDIREGNSFCMPSPGRAPITFSHENYSFFCRYEPLERIGSTFFDFQEIDNKSVVLTLGDVPGFGWNSEIMPIITQTLYSDHFRTLRERRHEQPEAPAEFEDLLFRINAELCLHQHGRFLALQLLHIDNQSGEIIASNAGAYRPLLWKTESGKLEELRMDESPAVGIFENQLIQMQAARFKESGLSRTSPYDEYHYRLAENDILFLMADGCEESMRQFRNSAGEPLRMTELSTELIVEDLEEREDLWGDWPLYAQCRDSGDWSPILDVLSSHGTNMEMFGPWRIRDIIRAVMTGGIYTLKRCLDQLIREPLIFDFSRLEATPENAVLAVMAVEKVFRLIPAPAAGPDDTIMIDRQIESFLSEIFTVFQTYYRYRLPDDGKSDPRYAVYTHLREDPQNDDFILMAYQRHKYQEPLEQIPEASEQDIPLEELRTTDFTNVDLEELEAVPEEED